MSRVKIYLTHPRREWHTRRYGSDPGFPAYLKGKVAVFSAYFDESGHDDKFLVVGGMVSKTDRWVDFTEECERIKAFFRIRYIHATELFNLNKTKLYGHLSLGERRQLLGCFLWAINQHAEFSLCSAVVPSLYNSLTTDRFRSANGSAYTLCVHGLLFGLWEILVGESGPDQTVSVFFEEGHPRIGEALDTVRAYKASIQPLDLPVIGKVRKGTGFQIGMSGTGTKDDSPPLWAADLISYCTYCQITRGPGDELTAQVLDAIEGSVPGAAFTWDEERIKWLIDLVNEGEAANSQWLADSHELVKYVHQFGVMTKSHFRGVVFDTSAMSPEQLQAFFSDDADKETK